jgi:hypothetical protein
MRVREIRETTTALSKEAVTNHGRQRCIYPAFSPYDIQSPVHAGLTAHVLEHAIPPLAPIVLLPTAHAEWKKFILALTRFGCAELFAQGCAARLKVRDASQPRCCPALLLAVLRCYGFLAQSGSAANPTVACCSCWRAADSTGWLTAGHHRTCWHLTAPRT